ncbi:MAG: hypothetical protein CM15mP87_06440 [Candidatus Neomarinimicrobiota bacterium]|nr:MAG: hypothetical protein CM15mP87_06440 [Candidatus Neomarinimicrobiota bacterium]
MSIFSITVSFHFPIKKLDSGMNSYLMTNFTYSLFFFYLFLKNLIADEVIKLRHFAVENDGLLESTVYDLFQFLERYMWITASNGLNKYDGNSKESLFREC